jgi:hypothetical protein
LRVQRKNRGFELVQSVSPPPISQRPSTGH